MLVPPHHPGQQLLDVHLNDWLIELQAQQVASTILDCASPAVSLWDTLNQRTGNGKNSESLESVFVHSPLHLKTFPTGNLNSLFPHLPFPAKKSEYKPQENVSQTWPSICLHQWHPQGMPTVRRGKNPGPGRGIWQPINPVTALRTLKPTLGFLSETRDVYEPPSPIPMATHPARDCVPTHELAETSARLRSLCHLPVVTLH